MAKKRADKSGGLVGEIIPHTKELALEAIKTDAEFRTELMRTIRALFENMEQIERTGTKVLGPIGELWGFGGALIRTTRDYLETKWQLENAAKVYDLVREKAADRGLEIGDFAQIETRVAIPYREGISNEDRPEFQEMWANLILNAVDPSSPIVATKAYKAILTELEPIDAAFFGDLCKLTMGKPFSLWSNDFYRAEQMEIELPFGLPMSKQKRFRLFELMPPKGVDIAKYEPEKVQAQHIMCKQRVSEVDLTIARLSKIGLVEKPVEIDRFNSEFLLGPPVLNLENDPPSVDSVTSEEIRETFEHIVSALGRWSISALGRDFAAALSLEIE